MNFNNGNNNGSNNSYADWLRQQMSMQNSMSTNRYAPHYEVIRVNGLAGANSFQMGPNSSQILADTTKSDRVWLVMTDGAGYLSAKPFKIIPDQDEQPQQQEESTNSFEKRLRDLEEKYDQLSGTIRQSKKQRNKNGAATTNVVAADDAE